MAKNRTADTHQDVGSDTTGNNFVSVFISELKLFSSALKAGRLQMELHPRCGSAAFLKVNDIHSTMA